MDHTGWSRFRNLPGPRPQWDTRKLRWSRTAFAVVIRPWSLAWMARAGRLQSKLHGEWMRNARPISSLRMVWPHRMKPDPFSPKARPGADSIPQGWFRYDSRLDCDARAGFAPVTRPTGARRLRHD